MKNHTLIVSEHTQKTLTAKEHETKINKMVVENQDLVYRIAAYMMLRLPSSVQMGDVTQAGFYGLLMAARNYDDTQGASFTTYAGIRIRGAILDDMRRTDWTPRSVYRKHRAVKTAARNVENKKCGKALDVEIADEMGISLDEYFRIISDRSYSNIFSMDDVDSYEGLESSTPDGSPPEILNKIEMKKQLAENVNCLEDAARFVIVMYYYHGLTLVEIGSMLGVTESRACQIRGESVEKLGRTLKVF